MLNRLAGRRGHSQRGGSTRVRTLVTWSRLLLCLLLLPVRERLVRHGATDADGHRGPDGGPRQGDAEMSMTSFHMSRILSSRAWHSVTRQRAAGVSLVLWSRRAATRCSRAASKSYWRLPSRLSARTSMVTPRVRRCGTQTAGTEAGTEGSGGSFRRTTGPRRPRVPVDRRVRDVSPRPVGSGPPPPVTVEPPSATARRVPKAGRQPAVGAAVAVGPDPTSSSPHTAWPTSSRCGGPDVHGGRHIRTGGIMGKLDGRVSRTPPQ